MSCTIRKPSRCPCLRTNGTRAQPRRAGGNLPAVCYCPSTGRPAAVNISATRQVGLVSADQPVAQSSDQNAPGGNRGPANGLALSDQPSRITLQRPLMVCFSTWVKSKKKKSKLFFAVLSLSLVFTFQSLRVRAPGCMPGQLDCLQLHASCTRDSLLEATGIVRRQPWDNLIGTNRAPSSVRDGVLALEGLR